MYSFSSDNGNYRFTNVGKLRSDYRFRCRFTTKYYCYPPLLFRSDYDHWIPMRNITTAKHVFNNSHIIYTHKNQINSIHIYTLNCKRCTFLNIAHRKLLINVTNGVTLDYAIRHLNPCYEIFKSELNRHMFINNSKTSSNRDRINTDQTTLKSGATNFKYSLILHIAESNNFMVFIGAYPLTYKEL